MAAKEILEWRESLIKLPDQQFFNLMNLYLGKLKTPFNKQNLLEQLTAFLYKQTNKDIILKSLDETDILILTAIHEICNITQDELIDFFSHHFTYAEIYEHILNMEERLLIFKIKTEEGGSSYKINPLLQKEIESFISKDIFILPEQKKKTNVHQIVINDVFLAAIYSFCFQYDGILKNDGFFKKKYLECLQNIIPIFTEKKELLPLVFTACENLGLLIRSEDGYIVQQERWLAFSELTNIEKYAYFISASVFKMRKENLQLFSQVIFNFINCLQKDTYYKKEDLEQYLFFLIRQSFTRKYLHSEILDRISFKNSNVNFIDIAKNYGIICEEDDLFFINPALKIIEEKKESSFLITPAFNITILPGADLKNILEPIEGIVPVLVQTAGEFSITKESCIKFFQKGLSADDLCNTLNRVSGYVLPKNVSASIHNWYNNFTSFSIYKGFVISVTKEKEVFFEAGMPLNKLVRKKLAPCVYLLNTADLTSFETVFSDLGLDFIFYKEEIKPNLKKDFFRLKPDDKISVYGFSDKSSWKKTQSERKSDYEEIIADLNSVVEKMNLSMEEKEFLNCLILRKAIITKEQILHNDLKLKKREALGIDFAGKQKLAEIALSCNHNLEVHINTGNGVKKIFGYPLQIIKKHGDAELVFIAEPEKEKINISIGQTVKIKLIYNYIFAF